MDYLLWENSKDKGDAFIYGGWPASLRQSFYSGDRITAAVPPIEITMNAESQGRLTDNLLLTGRGYVFSKKLLDVLRETGVDNIDAYPCTVRNLVTNEVHRQYSVVNVVGKVECIDRAQSEVMVGGPAGDQIIGYEYLTLDESRIHGWRLFLLAELPVQIVAHREVAEAIKRSGITGAEFVTQG